MKFSDKLITELMRTHLEDSKTKISADAVKLLSELLGLITIEGATRASQEAKKEGDDTVDTSHMEKILAQFLLDI